MSDRFVSPRPTFTAPTNESALEATTPRPRDHTPAPSVVQRVEQLGNADLAALLAEAQQQAREHAQARLPITRQRTPRAERLPSFDEEETTAPVAASRAPKFQPSDVLDDATFIRRTRDTNIHTPEMQALFWANGGERHMVAGLTYAQGFDNLRREKTRRLQGVSATAVPYQRNSTLQQGTQSHTPGMPSQQDRVRQREAQARRIRLVSNETWAGVKK